MLVHFNSIIFLVCLWRIEKFWRQIWSQIAFFYKHIFTFMFDSGTLIIIDEFHNASLHVVFVPTFQKDVNHMVITWNVHMVHKITKNGRFIPFHVPTHVFQPHEKELEQVIHKLCNF